MKQDVRRIALAAVIPLFLIFILYLLKFLEVGMDWDFRRLGVYPMEQRGVFGIFAHPLVHGSLRHLLANTLPLFFLSWCLFYFYRHIVITKLGGPKEYYSNMATVINPYNVDEIGKAICKALDTKSFQPNLAEYINKNYSIDTISRHLEQILFHEEK